MNEGKNKYLSFEDIKKKYNDLANKPESVRFVEDSFSIDFIVYTMTKEQMSQEFLLKTLMLPEECADNILDFGSLVEGQAREKLLTVLLGIYDARVLFSNKDRSDILSKTEVLKLLQKTFNIFNSLERPKRVLTSILKNVNMYEDMAIVLLEQKRLFYTLLRDKEFVKQASNYNKVVDGLFENLKDNQR